MTLEETIQHVLEQNTSTDACSPQQQELVAFLQELQTFRQKPVPYPYDEQDEGQDAATLAFDEIAKLCGCPDWDYPGQLVRDVARLVKDLSSEVTSKKVAGSRLLLIGCDTSASDGQPQAHERQKAIHTLVKSADSWWHFLDSVWLVQSERDVKWWRTKLKSEISEDDKLLILEVQALSFDGHLPQHAWDWLGKRCLTQDES
jgi:hypothetical protein